LAQGVRCAGQVEIGGLEAAPDWRRAEILRKHLAEVIPSLDTSNAKVWMGHRPSTPDGMPVIGPASEIAGMVHAFGHGHVGLVGSARTGRLAAQLVTGETPEIDLGGFSPRRFLRRPDPARDAGSRPCTTTTQ
jgi:D-amino-acid dehydrogenase